MQSVVEPDVYQAKSSGQTIITNIDKMASSVARPINVIQAFLCTRLGAITVLNKEHDVLTFEGTVKAEDIVTAFHEFVHRLVCCPYCSSMDTKLGFRSNTTLLLNCSECGQLAAWIPKRWSEIGLLRSFVARKMTHSRRASIDAASAYEGTDIRIRRRFDATVEV